MRRLHGASAVVALGVASAAVGSIPIRTILAVEPTVVVQPGDTLTSIAARHGVSTDHLAAWNELANPNLIFAGQLLRVALDPAATALVRPETGTHTVVAGETLTAIAARHGTTVAALASLNQLADPSFILAGQVLNLPTADAAAAVAATGWVLEVVQPGDTLTAIAARHGTTVGALVEANGTSDPSLIFAGTTVLVPDRAVERSQVAAPAASAPAATNAAATALGASPSAPSVAASAAPSPPAAPVVEPGAAAAMPDWMATLTVARHEVRRLIVAEASELGVPAVFALAVAWQESGWQQSVVSSSGAIGVMQLLPDTGAWVADAMLHEPVDVYAPESNVRAGVRLLRHYLDRYGDERLALAAYFQGQRAVDERGIYPESVPYIDSILYHERFFGD
ncbi:MAG: LysM peptidoglycan-binding domain-containing protein [Candidatus Limnocylindria bacterium]